MPTADRHPTAQAILDAAIADMEATGEASIRITKVLEAAGAVNGSLYHHFGSREGLVQEAIAERFVGSVSQGLAQFAVEISAATTTEELFAVFRKELVRIGTPEVRLQRARRMTTLAAALPRPQLLERITAAQASYFDAAGEVIGDLQRRGLINSEVDTRAFSAWFLGLSLSRLLSEIDPVCEPEGWWTELTYQSLVAILTPKRRRR